MTILENSFIVFPNIDQGVESRVTQTKILVTTGLV